MATLIRCDDSHVVSGRSVEDMPYLVDRYGRSICVVNDYLRERYCRQARPMNTVDREARALLDWANHTEKGMVINGRSRAKNKGDLDDRWGSITDADIRAWGNELAKSVNEDNANYKCRMVAWLYYWSKGRKDQSDGYKYFSGYQPVAGINDIETSARFAITMSAGGRRPTWSENIRGTPAPSNSPYPSDADIKNLNESLIDYASSTTIEIAHELLERNSLMAEVMESCGLRAAEVTNLSIDDLPPIDSAYKAQERNVTVILKVVGKGNKSRPVHMVPDLLLYLWDHVENAREEILGWKNRGSKSTSRAVFVSDKTGDALGVKTIGRIFKTIGGGTVQPHMLRRKSLTRGVKKELELARKKAKNNGGIVDDATILARWQRQAGHNDVSTLVSAQYLQLAKEEMDKEAQEDDTPYIESEAYRMQQRKINRLEAKINQYESSNNH